MDFPREWTAFGGVSLVLMGVAIGAGARRHAEDNLAWRREWRRAVGAPEAGPGEGRRLVLAFRVGGALGVLVGLVFAAAAVAGRPLTSARFGPEGVRVLGGSLALLGAGVAASSLYRLAARGPRFLALDPLAAPSESPLGERVAAVAGGLLCALWIWFGFRLLRA